MQCCDCGKPCGLRNPESWRGDRYRCEICALKYSNHKVKVILGCLFLALSALLAMAVTAQVFRPFLGRISYDTVKSIAIGSGVVSIILYIATRVLTNKVGGCLVRVTGKMVGFFAYAYGLGILILTLFFESHFKLVLGVEKEKSTSVEVSSPK